VPDALSGLSPYLHFGQLAPQRAAIEAAKCKSVHKVKQAVFVVAWVFCCACFCLLVRPAGAAAAAAIEADECT